MGTYERDAFVKTEKSVGPCTMKGTLMKFITTAMPARPALSPERLFVTIGLTGAGGGAAGGESENVTEAFQPSGQFSAANSL